MAITFVQESTTHNSSANSLTPSEPAGAAQNDLIIAFAAINANGGTWTDPADFTEIDQREDEAFDCYIGYKVRSSTAGSGYTFSTSASAAQMAVTLICLRGINTTTPLDVTFVAANHQNHYSNDVTSAAKAITTVTDGAWVMLFQHWNGGIAGFALGAPSGYTARSQILQASRVNFVCSKEIAVAGTETPGAYTTTGSPTTQDSSNWTLAIRPASSGVEQTISPNSAGMSV